MKIQKLHKWDVTPSEAIEIQKSLAAQVIREDKVSFPAFIAGADVSAKRGEDTATAAVVVMHYPDMELVDSSIVMGKPDFPYIPGLLSFRESPLVLQACLNLKVDFDLMLVDGQGFAHPRRMGLACHLGLLLDKPTIGCAKSRLIGKYQEPPDLPGACSPLVDEGEIIGAVMRTRSGTKPLFVSIGHKVDLGSATHWVMTTCRSYRIPEPLRRAHLAASGKGVVWQ